MAGKAQLHTVFTGDDSHFQRTVRRVQGAGKRVAAIGSKLTGALGALGAGIGFKHVLDSVDQTEKAARGLDMTTESLQRLTFATEQAGGNFSQLKAILYRLKRRTAEALTDPASSAAKGFKKLNIDVQKFQHLKGDEMFKRFSDAFKEGGEGVMATGASMGVLDTEVRELIPTLKLGSDGITELGKGASVWGPEAGAAIEGLKDKFHALANKGIVSAVKAIEQWLKVVDWLAEKMQWLMDTGMGAIVGLTTSDITIGEGIAGAHKTRADEKEKERKRKELIAEASKKLDDPTGINLEAAVKKTKAKVGGKHGIFEMVAGFAAGGAGAPLSSAAKKSQSETSKFFKEAKVGQGKIIGHLGKIAGGIAR